MRSGERLFNSEEHDGFYLTRRSKVRGTARVVTRISFQEFYSGSFGSHPLEARTSESSQAGLSAVSRRLSSYPRSGSTLVCGLKRSASRTFPSARSSAADLAPALARKVRQFRSDALLRCHR
jgi:hypothetical protein